MRKYVGFINTFILFIFLGVSLFTMAMAKPSASQTIVFQSDYGLKDAGVPILHGIARSSAPDLKIDDLTHEIPAFNIWEASYRLKQTLPYWPQGTVFVSFVSRDNGINSDALAIKTKTGHYVIAPNNGTFTLLADRIGIEEARLISEVRQRQDSARNYPLTHYGRDAYAYVGARLAGDLINFEDIGPVYQKEIAHINYQKPSMEDKRIFYGNIPVLEFPYGNVWTNIPYAYFEEANVEHGDVFNVTITQDGKEIYQNSIPFGQSFSSVPEGRGLIYTNELNYLSLALNIASFAQTYDIGSGPGWSIKIEKY